MSSAALALNTASLLLCMPSVVEPLQRAVDTGLAPLPVRALAALLPSRSGAVAYSYGLEREAAVWALLALLAAVITVGGSLQR